MSLEKKPQKVSIEFGHTYTDSGLVQSGESMHRGIRELQRELTAFEMRCKENGNAAVEIARQLELTAKTHVLLDDVEWSYEQSRSHGNTDRIALFRARSLQGAEIAFSPDSAQSEGSLVPQAKARLDSLPSERSHIRLDTQTGKQRVRIRGFTGIEDETHPSCDILDLVWHEKRADEADILLTILHQAYESQQARVHALAEHITGTKLNDASAATLLLDDAGTPVALRRWSERSEKAKLYFDVIESRLVAGKTTA
ncbi:MAG TPA: hypothetical protein VJL39_00125 [Candidatus Paceibacterota bacterium]